MHMAESQMKLGEQTISIHDLNILSKKRFKTRRKKPNTWKYQHIHKKQKTYYESPNNLKPIDLSATSTRDLPLDDCQHATNLSSISTTALASIEIEKLKKWIEFSKNPNLRPSIQELVNTLKNIYDNNLNTIQNTQTPIPPQNIECATDIDLRCKETSVNYFNEFQFLSEYNIMSDRECNTCDKLLSMGIRILDMSYVQNLKTIKPLGVGGYGSCKLVSDNDKLYVVKTFYYADSLSLLMDEVVQLKQIESLNLQKLIGVCVRTRQMITEYAGTSISKMLNDGMTLSNLEKVKIMYDVSCSIKNMIDLGVVHNDIKLSNICIDSNKKVTIIDYGLSCTINDVCVYVNDTKNCKEYPWMDPELFRYKSKCTESSEIYSLLYCIKELFNYDV
ncbi:serine/threonine kinase [Callinectes sapidus nudivirus]|nr:serine/threonine kinase [Callinectes sapidus nudivirus]